MVIKTVITCRLRNVDEISGNPGFQGQGQGHDREGHSTAAFGGGAADESPDDHRHRHGVVLGEVLEVVVPETSDLFFKPNLSADYSSKTNREIKEARVKTIYMPQLLKTLRDLTTLTCLPQKVRAQL